MNVHIFVIVLLSLANVEVGSTAIAPDLVQPFAQPEPITVAQTAASKFKPSLHVVNGCQPYAAVDANGNFSAGLNGSLPDSACQGSSLGSQVYTRSSKYESPLLGTVWAIMYAWYFPKNTPDGDTSKGVTHDWVSAIVWIDDPILDNPDIYGVSVSVYKTQYFFQGKPIPATFIDGQTFNFAYLSSSTNGYNYHTIVLSQNEGRFQNLIDWSQLTDAARTALNTADFGKVTPVPFNEANFVKNLASGLQGTSSGSAL